MRKGIIVCVFLVVLLAVPVTFVSAAPSLTSVTMIGGNTIFVTYLTSNPVTIDTPGYTATSDTVTYNGVSYDAVDISNDSNPSGGISNGNGRVNVTFDLNDNRPFCFEFYHPSLDASRLVLRVTIDGTARTYMDSPSSLWDWASNVRHYIGYSDKYTSMQAVGNADDWLQSDNVINIQIQDQYGQILSVPDNVTLKIVFKP